MRRPEQVGVYQFVGSFNVFEIGLGGDYSALHMVHGVVAHTVATAQHLLKQFGMPANIIADHKERGFHAIAVEGVEHPRRNLGNRAIVEGEINTFFLLLYTPHTFRKQHPVEQRWLFNKHNLRNSKNKI